MTKYFEDTKEENWQFNKRVKDCDLYFRKNACKHSSFRVAAAFDFPPQIIIDYFSKIEIRLTWDEDYESI